MRVIVVEDETAAAVNLMSMLHHAFPQMEVAAQLGISRSYISRIEKRAMERLSNCWRRETPG